LHTPIRLADRSLNCRRTTPQLPAGAGTYTPRKAYVPPRSGAAPGLGRVYANQ